MEYSVEYSKRKNITISVKGGVLVVKAPHKTSREAIEKVLMQHRRWIETHLERAKERARLESELDGERISELKRAAREYLTPLTAYYASIMGVRYGRISISSARTRFGSCSSRGNISYSYRLMLYPDDAIRYVVVHELAHIREMNHSARFYSIVASVFPDYERRRALLKKVPK